MSSSSSSEAVIHDYCNELNLKTVIESFNLKDIDEAVYVCDLTRVVEKFHLWHKYLPNVKPYYAVKCNDDAQIVELMASLGSGFDCASKNEMKQILELGVTSDRIIFANPCKIVSHLQYAEEYKVQTMTVDNEFEIFKVHKYYPEARLVIRIRCDAKKAQCMLGDKFGCSTEGDAAALMLLAKRLGLHIVGISFHVGSGCKDFAAYDRAITTSKILFKFGLQLGFDMNLLDIGGGFPGADEKSFQIIASIINESLKRNFSNHQGIEVIAEPGRFFVASAFSLICKVHGKREERLPNSNKIQRKMYFLNDGVYGAFNCIIYDHQEVFAEHFLDDDGNKNLKKFNTILWGPSCDALDKIAENLYLPDLRYGDFLAFRNMGAYTIPIASPFNGFENAKILYFRKLT